MFPNLGWEEWGGCAGDWVGSGALLAWLHFLMVLQQGLLKLGARAEIGWGGPLGTAESHLRFSK